MGAYYVTGLVFRFNLFFIQLVSYQTFCKFIVFYVHHAKGHERSTHMDGQWGSLKSEGNCFMFLFQNRFCIWWMSVKTMSVGINMAIMSERACQVGCDRWSYCIEIEHGCILRDEVVTGIYVFFAAISFAYSLWNIKRFASSFSPIFTMPKAMKAMKAMKAAKKAAPPAPAKKAMKAMK